MLPQLNTEMENTYRTIPHVNIKHKFRLSQYKSITIANHILFHADAGAPGGDHTLGWSKEVNRAAHWENAKAPGVEAKPPKRQRSMLQWTRQSQAPSLMGLIRTSDDTHSANIKEGPDPGTDKLSIPDRRPHNAQQGSSLSHRRPPRQNYSHQPYVSTITQSPKVLPVPQQCSDSHPRFLSRDTRRYGSYLVFLDTHINDQKV